ncbi:nif11-like leader peptide domain-containing protein [Fulvimarina manganoxydans]|uniref:Nif11-like leader peptide domain-containing protein n=1 Tax=Fulvimarina manganoxydans TaxID=937218 RepID=A0A1W2D2V6_9HYPH|nr:Nif11-like leader peptide family RiPP precursor [Fulvimarina manganoxydans]SMC91895.1 nif11-like leader peptide domain-containing protein [Fulvimarina manganoxydans]
MSMQALNDFADAMRADADMAKGLVTAVGQKQDGEATEAFAAYARQHGFEITAQDLAKLRRPAESEGTLSDDELETVSGAGLFDFVGDIGSVCLSTVSAGQNALFSGRNVVQDMNSAASYGVRGLLDRK